MHTANTAAADVSLDTTDAALQRQARRRVKLKMGFFLHALVFTLVNLGLLTLHAVTGGERGLHVPLWGWAFGLAIHGTVVFARLQFRTQGLRERMVAREVERLRTRD
ncbi:2TM domain-containing protein [Sphaerotilus sp.]|uniref:2TM domain-containing protein n=1 Tax=Sphaerotilus sp. TaxID=2093942 RepID=UPI002ACD933D|nr:2TM domain-containing protein [Sphaerotilus sp.]MDZ7858866.1 2TM domain-containing protein [Sphaerotilus sp.]